MSAPIMARPAAFKRYARSAFPQLPSSWHAAEKVLLSRGLRQDGVAKLIRSGVHLAKVVDRETGEPRGERLVSLSNKGRGADRGAGSRRLGPRRLVERISDRHGPGDAAACCVGANGRQSFLR